MRRPVRAWPLALALLPFLSLQTLACSHWTAGQDGAAPGQSNRPANGRATDALADPEVRRVHSRMMAAMGGADAWESARYFEFDFVVYRGGQEAARWRHRWDRWRGDYRLSGIRRGDTILALFNVNHAADGRVWLNGQPVQPPRADSLRQFAYARFINDSYWLIMPYKWTDPGVHLSYAGRQTDPNGRAWEAVKLTFENVGLTPENEYLAFISPETGLMERWHHFPRAGAEPAIYDWTDWQRFGPILLSTNKPNPDRSAAIRFENVRVDTRVPAGAFQS
ncbi:MAG: hypothetical protein HY703_04115 [Gemmatimonadetes bacterium]|nr:hypothetical protein [Gemmatimonadota bacterium]